MCHEANKAFCETINDFTKKSWDNADTWQRESAMNGVRFFINNPGAKDSTQHDSWMNEKKNDGWVYGRIKDPENKTHPCLIQFERLPLEQQAKDSIFRSICKSLVHLVY